MWFVVCYCPSVSSLRTLLLSIFLNFHFIVYHYCSSLFLYGLCATNCKFRSIAVTDTFGHSTQRRWILDRCTVCHGENEFLVSISVLFRSYLVCCCRISLLPVVVNKDESFSAARKRCRDAPDEVAQPLDTWRWMAVSGTLET